MYYYITHGDGHEIGPLKKEEMMHYGLTPSTLVWKAGMETWLPANQFQELNSLFTAPPPLQPTASATQQTVTLQPVNTESTIRPPIKLHEKTPYDFRCPTWTKEAWILLAIVVGHFILGITGTTSFFYIYFDLIGFALCLSALIIGHKINTLNKASYAQGTASRIKGDKLARINGWLVSITALIGIIIILIQSGLDMFGESIGAGISYSAIYIILSGLLWFFFFRPIKLDNYSLRTSPTIATNARQKKIEEADLRRWRKERRKQGLSPRLDSDDSDGDYDSDSYDSDSDDDGWDDFDDDDDYDWGGGDGGGGGASSDW